MKNIHIPQPIAIFLILFLFPCCLGIQKVRAQAPIITYSGVQAGYTVGQAISPLSPSNTGGTPINTIFVSTLAGSTQGFANGTGIDAHFNKPAGVAVDAIGNVYVADRGNHSIRKITPAGVVTTLAGSGLPGFAEGMGIAAQFIYPSGVAVDAAGNVYVADKDNHRIRKITSAGVVTTLAGSGLPGSAIGTGATAQFNDPTGVAVDASGNVFVADYGNHRIRKITPASVVTNFAGSGTAGFANGTSSVAKFNYPTGVAVDAAGNIYVADYTNNRIRKITSSGVVTTPAGSGAYSFADGTGTDASFNYPRGVAVDAAGNVFVADQYNNRIRKITPPNVVTTLAGSGTAGFANGTGTTAQFNLPAGVAVDVSGNIYVADYTNNRIRKITTTAYTISPALPLGLSFNTTTGVISGTPTVVTPTTTYTITAYNAAGSFSTTISFATFAQAALTVSNTGNNGNASYLVQNVLIGGCLTISNITYTGSSSAIGYFSNASPMGISEGIILSTGAVSSAPGPNGSGEQSTSFSTPGDATLNALPGGVTQDAAVLQFSFLPISNTVSFNFIFASEEYPEYVGSAFNDVFGFFISGPGVVGQQNIALVPGTTTPITINTINSTTNPSYYITNTGSVTQFDGYTQVLTATASGLIPCQTYTIKLAIADVGDTAFDSAVFLKANSFNAGQSVAVQSVVPTSTTAAAYEGCQNGYFIFTRPSDADLSLPLSIPISVSGSATPNVDYAALPATAIIPAGETSVILNINAYSDALAEGSENIIVSIQQLLCNCTSLPPDTISIYDSPELFEAFSSSDPSICSGNATLIEVIAAGSQFTPYTYQWNNGGIGSSIIVAPATTTTYTITITDGCGRVLNQSVTVNVSNTLPTPTISGNTNYCQNSTATLTASGGSTYLWNTSSTSASIFPSTATADNYTYTVTVTSSNGCTASVSKTIVIVTTPTISAVTPSCVSGTGRIIVTASGGSNLTYKLGNGSPQSSNIFNNLANGTYTITVSNSNGCSTTATTTINCTTCPIATALNNGPKCAGNNITLSVQPNLPAGVTATYIWGAGLGNNNTASVNASGTYTVTVTYSNGCSATASTSVTVNALPTPAISGGGTICNGSNVALSTTNTYNTYIWPGSPSTSQTATYNNVTTPTTYTVTVTNANGCTATTTTNVTINALPTPAISGGGAICSGSNVALSTTNTYNTYAWSGSPSTSQTATYNNVTTPTTYTVTVTNANGCTNTANTTVTINPPPTASISGTTSFCSGGSTTLTASGGATYTWSNGANTAAATINSAGNYTVTVSNNNGCTSTGSVTITVTNAPTITLTPGTNQTICSGNSLTFSSSSGLGGCNIQWQESAVSPVVWTDIIGATQSTYTIAPTTTKKYRVYYICGACSTSISTAVTVTVNTSPAAYNIIGGGSYCAGGGGVAVGLSGSQVGVTYQLKKDNTNIGILVTGTGGNFNFFNQTNVGIYTIVATNNTNDCSTTMIGSVAVSVIPNPTVYSLTGGGAYCEGGNGVVIGLSGSQAGVIYQLKRDGLIVSSATGGGGVITFSGNQTTAGIYTVVATNSGGCTANMSNNVTVSVIPMPTQYALTGGGSYCAGSGGVAVGLSDSEMGVIYQLQNNGNNIGSPFSGTGSAIPFGNQNNAGTYTVVANNSGCTIAMIGSASVVINSSPTASISPAGAVSVCAGQSTTLTASGGGTYQWSNGLGTSSSISPAPNNTTTYTVTVTAANGCTKSATKTIAVNALPSAIITPSGPTTFCQGGSVNLVAGGGASYQWSSGSSASAYVANASGNYTVTVTNAYNCSASASVSVTVNALPPTPIILYNGTAATNVTACDQATFSIAPISGISYQWKKNGNITSGTSANYTASSSGSYTVQATNNATNCPSLSNAANLSIYASPNALLTAEGSTNICPTDSVKLKVLPAGSAYNYLWSNGATSSNIWVQDAGSYTVTLTRNYNGIGCTDVADALNIVVKEAPTAKATYTTQKNMTTFVNQSIDAVSYVWDFGDGTSVSTAVNPTHEYQIAGYFTVTLTATNAQSCIHTIKFGVLIMPDAADSQSVLYPNPNDGNFTLNVPLGSTSVVVVDVFDETGRLLKRYSSEENQGLASLPFSLSNLSSGIYILGVYIDDKNTNSTDFVHGLLANKPLKYNHYRKLIIVD